MKLLFVASEAVPLVKTGGLADVAGSLPKALQARGAEVRIMIPKYESIPQSALERMETIATFTVGIGWRQQYCGLQKAEIDGIIYYFIDNEFYFKRGDGLYGYGDDAERFVFFSLAVAEAMSYMDYRPELLHCHDWQTGLIPFLLKTRYRHDPACRDLATVFTIHNLKYQGVFGKELLMDLLGAGEELFGQDGIEFYGAGSCMKGALLCADKLTTVSPTYAQEIQTDAYGERLDGLLRSRSADLVGIVNGIDTASFDPMADPALEFSYRNALTRKRKNKLSLQRELGLPEAGSTPLIGVVSRLVDQKGFDLVEAILERLVEEDMQLVVLGSGHPHYEYVFQSATERWPDKVKVWFGFNDALARRIYAGSDMYLMPSLFEPCGLSQLIALRYRSVPIVRETGGLKDTVLAYNEYTGEGNGFSFTHYNADDLLYTVRRALACYQDDPTWEKIVANGGRSDYSWDQSARTYMSLYADLLSKRKENITWPVIS